MDKKYGIVCLSEHWLSAEEMQVLRIERYRLASYFARSKHTGGGVAIFVKDAIGAIKCDITEGFCIEGCIECCGVHVIDFDVYILTIYRPPQGCFDSFLGVLEAILNKIGLSRRIILAGDFNVHFNTDQTEALHLGDTLRSFGFEQTITAATRSGACLDNIFVNFCRDTFSAGVVDVSISDHLGQELELLVDIDPNNNRREYKVCRPLTRVGFVVFYNIVSAIHWDFVGDHGLDVNAKFSRFLTILEESYK